MSKEIIWSPLAEKDFEDILDYLVKEWNAEIAFKFIDITDHLLNQIAKQPNQFTLIYKKLKVRKCVISKHNSLYYRNSRNHVDLLRNFEKRQDPKKLKF
jgi:plasmid stabilization system protein ParE